MDDGYFYPRDNDCHLYLGRVSKEEAETARDQLEAVGAVIEIA